MKRVAMKVGPVNTMTMTRTMTMLLLPLALAACGGPAGGPPATTTTTPRPTATAPATTTATAPAVHPFTRQMEGMWHQYNGVVDGRNVPEEQFAGHGSLFTTDTWQWCMKGQPEGPPLVYTVSGDGPTYALDILWQREIFKGQQLGIVTIDERGELVTCIAPMGKPRPTTFESAPGSGVSLQRYRRVLGDWK